MLCFTRFWSRVAQNSVNFALVLLIVRTTDKAFMSSLLVLALVVPSTVAGIVAGTAADAFPKRLLIFFGDVTRAAICVWFVWSGGGAIEYFIIAILISTFAQFATAAEGAVTPAIVTRAEFARANAIGHAVGGGAQLLGLGVLTPIALRLLDNADALFLICAVMFGVAAFQALAIGRIRSPDRAEVGGEASGGPWWSAGWRAIRSDPAVLHSTIELTLISAALIILAGLIPTYINDVLGLPVDIGAVILTPAALGVALGLRIAGFLAHRVPHAALSTFGFAGFVIFLALVTFTNQLAEFLGGYGAFAWLNSISIGHFDGGGALAMLLVAPLGFCYATVQVAAQTVIHDRVPLHLQGRVNAMQSALSAIVSSAPVLAAGALADVVGVTPVMALLAAGTGVVAIMNMRPLHPASPEPAAAREFH